MAAGPEIRNRDQCFISLPVLSEDLNMQDEKAGELGKTFKSSMSSLYQI